MIAKQISGCWGSDGDVELSIICVLLLLNIMDPGNFGDRRSVNRRKEGMAQAWSCGIDVT